MDSDFLTTSNLLGAFQGALADAMRVDVAVAWGTDCQELSMLCNHSQAGNKLRMIIGRDGHATHPDAVRRLLAAAPGQVRWGRTPPQGIFHPKLFLFHQA